MYNNVYMHAQGRQIAKKWWCGGIVPAVACAFNPLHLPRPTSRPLLTVSECTRVAMHLLVVVHAVGVQSNAYLCHILVNIIL